MVIWAVDLARWHGVVGGTVRWLYVNTTGNIAAGFLQVGLGAVVGAVLWPRVKRSAHQFVDRKLKPIHEHNEWQARQLARHLAAQGTPVDDHPVHGRLTDRI